MNATRIGNRTSRTGAAVALLATLVAAPLGAQAPKPAGATAEVEKTLRAVLGAWQTLDPAKAAPFYAKDPGLAFFDLAPLKYAGWSEYEAGTKEIFSTFASLTITPNADLMVHAAGNWAWATSTVNATVTNKADAAHPEGEKMPLESRWTVILEKRADKWIIVHEHLSAPIEMPAAAPAPAKP